jgi:hypothetical protein
MLSIEIAALISCVGTYSSTAVASASNCIAVTPGYYGEKELARMLLCLAYRLDCPLASTGSPSSLGGWSMTYNTVRATQQAPCPAKMVCLGEYILDRTTLPPTFLPFVQITL